VIEGNWYEGKEHGETKYINKDGMLKICEFFHGKRIRVIYDQSK